MSLEEQLRIPGPTPVPDRVVRAASRPMINHRSRSFAHLLRDCVDGLQWGLDTANDVLLFPSSGTGAMEAVVANLVSPGETILVCAAGWFGELWGTIATAFGADVIYVRAPWGSPVQPAAVGEALLSHPEVSSVFATHNETSTGVTHDIAGIAEMVKGHGRLMVVDGIGGAGCLPLSTDELGLDVVVTASQKGWLTPPGLAMIAVSDDALRVARDARAPRWYFDFHKQRNFQTKGQTHTTPPLSVMYALAEGLAMLQEEGREEIWARHHRVAEAVRSGLQSIGLDLYADEECRSDTVTAVRSPFSAPEDLGAFMEKLVARYRLHLAEGHGVLRGEIFRVGHMGSIGESDAEDICARVARALDDPRLNGSGQLAAGGRTAARLSFQRQ